ncbi:MAG: ABC transporter permease [Candidatus Angelobacter sp. Gp1-AA117]|nr:MAG: ABC transporter permease [Candidatus Angelobacter sp. Gp1-AA117]
MADKTDQKKSAVAQLKSVWPQIRALIGPRRWLLAGSFILLIINRIAGLALPYSSRFLLDRVIPRRDLHLLTLLVLGVALASIIQAATSYVLMQSLSKEGQRAIADLRRKVQAHVSTLPVSYYDSTKTGSMVSRIMSDVEGVRNLIGTGLMEFAGGVLTAAIVLVLMVRISYVMTGVAVGALVVFSLILNKAFKKIRPIFRERGKINAEVSGRLTESLGGVRVVKGYHAEEREQSVFSAGVQRILDNVMRTLDAMASMSLGSTLMMGIVGAAIMYLGAREVISGKMTAGGLFQYTMYMGFLAAPVFQLANIGTQVTEAIAGLDRTREVLTENSEHADPHRIIKLPHITGELAFENVSFAYEPGKPVLEEIGFVAKPGTVTALVGSSGSGKSTIIGLVAAFYKPLKGRILVDNVDLSHVRLDSYRPALGVVLQESFLFDGTVRENIAFSRPDATEEEIMRACMIAHVDEFVEKFKDKYDTVIGERGVKLSGGQRQRVSIARAVLADPRILILDEATSSLDSESEAYIQQGLKYLMQGRTTFVIAHRLSTVRQADQILVVEAGHIVERGTHESLYLQQGRYYELYTRQHGLETNLFLAPGEGDKSDEKQLVGRAGGGTQLDAIGLIRGSGGV